ncbi:hypothetical protein C8J56DRAFT_955671 [Mycena floridula]|nr:hypothetical protein C8J56DRAFT_955671 [Mycena floridula]
MTDAPNSFKDEQINHSEAPVGQPEPDEQPEEEPAPYLASPPLGNLPEIPSEAQFDLSFIDSTSRADLEKVQKRASNVQKLAEENEKLKEQLKAMSDRLEAAERKRKQLAEKEQKVMSEPSS